MRSVRASVRRGAVRVALFAGALAVTVLLVHCDALIPRGGWSERWGPMVPHQTFPADCGLCHTPEDWSTLRTELDFDHDQETGFALVGAHAEAACLRCHNDRGPVAVYVARGCGGCHVDPHRSTLGLACEGCHNQRHWGPTGLVAEHARTRLPLIGVHAITPCETCHERATVGEFRGTPAECHGCHQHDAARAFPNHAINGWVRACERCHTPAAWSTPGFDHSGFPLLGGHAGVDCLDCHANGRFAGTPNDCFFCHRNDYLAAPDHVADGFSTHCLDCHNTNAWR